MAFKRLAVRFRLSLLEKFGVLKYIETHDQIVYCLISPICFIISQDNVHKVYGEGVSWVVETSTVFYGKDFVTLSKQIGYIANALAASIFILCICNMFEEIITNMARSDVG